MVEYMVLSDVENSWIDQIKSPKHIAVRILWLVCYLLMIGLGIYIVALLLIDYFTYSSYDLVSVEHGSKYTLPAITICSVNGLNKTKMQETKVKDVVDGSTDERTVYDLYQNLQKSYASRGAEVEDLDYEGIDDLELNRNFAFEIGETIIPEMLTFAKQVITKEEMSSYIRQEYTEMGKCFEINDAANLIQRIDGSTGGLTIVLDAMIQHYVDDTASEGFYVIIRMANETVLNREFSFLVSAGQQVFVKLDTVEITRLEPPYGSCVNTSDIFNKHAVKEDDVVSLKECFLEQQLWSLLREYQCRCFPWYFQERFNENTESMKYYPALNAILIDYFTKELDEVKQIVFNKTCTYPDTGYYKGGLLDKVAAVDVAACDAICRDTDECVVYMFSSEKNDMLNANECATYSEDTTLKTGSTPSGLTRGEVNCTGGPIPECPTSKYEMCNNLVLDNLMGGNMNFAPPQCEEPCAYYEYKYDLSTSEYPALNYWESALSKVVSNYDKFAFAKLNMVKLVFFTEQMKSTQAVQTGAYEMQNFIANVGGLTDFFMGISFFTVFQLLEWLMTVCVRSTKKKDKGNGNAVIGMK